MIKTRELINLTLSWCEAKLPETSSALQRYWVCFKSEFTEGGLFSFYSNYKQAYFISLLLLFQYSSESQTLILTLQLRLLT